MLSLGNVFVPVLAGGACAASGARQAEYIFLEIHGEVARLVVVSTLSVAAVLRIYWPGYRRAGGWAAIAAGALTALVGTAVVSPIAPGMLCWLKQWAGSEGLTAEAPKGTFRVFRRIFLRESQATNAPGSHHTPSVIAPLPSHPPDIPPAALPDDVPVRTSWDFRRLEGPCGMTEVAARSVRGAEPNCRP